MTNPLTLAPGCQKIRLHGGKGKSASPMLDGKADEEYLSMNESAFANRLIPKTIENAASVPFYERFWSGIDLSRIQSTADLQALPVLTKADAIRFTEEFDYLKAPSLLSHTSGTSGGITLRCRSQEELNCLAKVRQNNPLETNQGLTPLVLSVDCQNHGQMIPSNVGQFALKAVGFDFDVIDHVIQQITRQYSFPGYTERVCILHGSVGFMKLLTTELLRRQIAPSDLGVQMMLSYGEYLTDSWARKLKDLWSAPQINLYGASEVVGGARRCPVCGWLSFTPESFTEVVSLEDGTPIESGVGMLVLTELYPFSQLQPFIRFSTGDVVEVRNHNCSGAAAKNFRFLGRLDRCVRYPEGTGQVVLYASEVYSILDSLPWIHREQIFHRMNMDLWNSDLGAPLAKVSFLPARKTNSAITVHFEVISKFSPLLFPDFAAECAASVQRALQNSFRPIANNVVPQFEIDVSLTNRLDGAISFLAS